jgi:pyroglutamyl-peptidase
LADGARVLVTAFEPFANWSVNSSREAAAALAADRPGLHVRVLPVDHAAAAAALEAAVEALRPAVLLCAGLAPGAVPRLVLRARPPGALGACGPERRGLWPWAAALDAIRAEGLPARLSAEAGGYVCETVYWTALGRAGARDGPRRVAFLHLPPPGEVWPAHRLARALGACLDAGLRGLSPA